MRVQANHDGTNRLPVVGPETSNLRNVELASDAFAVQTYEGGARNSHKTAKHPDMAGLDTHNTDQTLKLLLLESSNAIRRIYESQGHELF